MSRRWVYLALVLAVALALAALETRGETPRPAAESAPAADPAPPAAASVSETPPATAAGSDACNRCDARQKDKARLRALLRALPRDDGG